MSKLNSRAVSGFYPWPVPVSISDQAAVFACGGALYRVDPAMNARRQVFSNEISQVVQREDGIFALEWTSGGEAALLKLDSLLRTVDRRVLFQGGPAGWREMADPYDLEDWRNQQEFCLLTEEAVIRLTFRPDGEDKSLTTALVLERTPLEGGETCRQVIGEPELERALGGDTGFGYFDVRAGDTQMWACRDQVYLHVEVWDDSGPRYLLLQIDGGGIAAVLWDSPDVREGRPCFFDFDRGIMWTCPRTGEAACPEDAPRLRYLPLTARKMIPDAPVLEGFPVWRGVDMFSGYFDGSCAFGVQEGLWAVDQEGNWSENWQRSGPRGPVVRWGDRLLLDLEGEGCPMAYPIQTEPPAAGEGLNLI